MTFVALSAAVLSLSGCGPDEGAAFAHAAADELSLHVTADEGNTILRDIQRGHPALTRSQILDRFRESAKEARDLLEDVGIGGCQAVEFREQYGFWPGTPVGQTLDAKTRNSSVTVDVLVAVCKADDLARSGF